MQTPDDYKDLQILGANVQVIMSGFGSFTLLASKILLESGLGKIDDEGVGMAVLDANQWYPLDRFLRAFHRIAAEFGDYTLRQAGSHINKVAVAPPAFWKDIVSAFQTIDAGYHMNHGKDGKPLFDPSSGKMDEGIGHMTYKPGTKPKQFFMECDTPYPCAFDEGIVQGLSQRFEPTSTVMHDRKSCRKRGDASCLYHINWK
jgi:hypothetical protein